MNYLKSLSMEDYVTLFFMAIVMPFLGRILPPPEINMITSQDPYSIVFGLIFGISAILALLAVLMRTGSGSAASEPRFFISRLFMLIYISLMVKISAEYLFSSLVADLAFAVMIGMSIVIFAIMISFRSNYEHLPRIDQRIRRIMILPFVLCAMYASGFLFKTESSSLLDFAGMVILGALIFVFVILPMRLFSECSGLSGRWIFRGLVFITALIINIVITDNNLLKL